MGGIKNKLSKLSNKVKNLLCPLSLKGADSPLGLTEGSISRWDRIAKYTSLACLSFAILSTLVLNIVSSSSSSSIESNAKQLGEVSTLANDSTCDPSNTNAASCISMSITSSSSSSSTDSNNPNLSLQIPREGGIAVGRHTVTVSTNNVTGWEMSLTGVDGNSKLVNTSNSNYSIDTLPANANTDNATILSNNTWGVALPYGNWVFIGAYDEEVNYLSKDSAVLATTRWSSLAAFSDSTSIAYDIVPTSTYNPGSRNICYGVRVDNPSELLAGDYTARVVYTATTKEVPAPILDSVNPASYELGSGADSKVTISGSNLKSAYSVYLTDSNNNEVPNGECTDIAIASDSNSLTCNMPTDQTNPDLEPGEYTIHVITQGGEATIGFTYTEKRLPDGILESTADYGASGHVAVDYDENMIPITYTGNETTPRWVIADASNTNSDTNLNWYDYPNKKWANAVTLTKEGLDKYKGQPVGTEIDEQYVLGYWVYIPRYAYKVMRRDAVDRPVSPQNFEIRFETKTDPKKYPARTCSAGANHQNYLSCPGVNGEHGAEEGTAWATHPAFSWIYTAATNGFDKTVEMNGFWIGKYETTGIVESPTVLPNNRHIGYLSSYNIGGYYSSAKLVGQKDNYNTGGANINSKNQNYHNLASQTSHMLKNSEWGAAAYLSASGYGAGVNKVQINANDEGSDFSATGVTGCGPYDDNSRIIYRDSGELGTVSACSRSNSSRVYHGQIGILASTTNTVYGVYDMAGGAWEYTMGDYTTSQNTTSSRYFSVPANTPYVDLYRQADGFGKQKPSWSESSNSAYYNFDLCTYETCGGQALHETMTVQTITGYNNSVQWGNSAALFPDADYEWAGRGGAASQASNSGIFYSNGSSGLTGGSGSSDTAFRISIINVADATGNS